MKTHRSRSKETRRLDYKTAKRKTDSNFNLLLVKITDQNAMEKIENLASNLKESVGMQYDRIMGFRRMEEDDLNHPDNLRLAEELKQKRAKETNIRETAAQRMRRASWSIEANNTLLS